MTQKEKIKEAFLMAQRVKSIAHNIEFDAKDYEERWPLRYVTELETIADNYLKLLK